MSKSKTSYQKTQSRVRKHFKNQKLSDDDLEIISQLVYRNDFLSYANSELLVMFAKEKRISQNLFKMRERASRGHPPKRITVTELNGLIRENRIALENVFSSLVADSRKNMKERGLPDHYVTEKEKTAARIGIV